MSTADSISNARGRPIVMLGVLLSVWGAARVLMWESPLELTHSLQDLSSEALGNREELTNKVETPSHSREHAATESGVPLLGRQYLVRTVSRSTLAAPPWEQPAASQSTNRAQTAAAHQLIWMTAMAYLPVPSAIEQRNEETARAGPAADLPQSRGDRWSLDGWVLWRDGSANSFASQGRVPTYGASQAGAVLRYRLAPRSGRDPAAYTRLYRALIDGGESEAALGLSARPIAELPVRAHAELRVTRFAEATELRPAGFVTTELPVAHLPLGVRAEAYAQAGYVAGEAATAFADGQVRLLRDVKRFDLGNLSLGAAAWGGAQKGAERVDVGPSVRFDTTVGDTPARLSVDYRERVAGNAEPPSGIAVTLSTRF